MSLYVLDTDTLTLWLRGQARVCDRVGKQDSTELCVSIITIEEMLRGWYSQIRRAKTNEEIERAYAALQQAVQIASQLPILAFDQAVIQPSGPPEKTKASDWNQRLKDCGHRVREPRCVGHSKSVRLSAHTGPDIRKIGPETNVR